VFTWLQLQKKEEIMKRLTLLAAALVLVLGMAVSASAAPEVAISGNLLVNAVWNSNWAFNDNQDRTQASTFDVYERADMYFTITANENLKGVLGLRSDKGTWGNGAFTNGQPGGGTTTGYGLSIRDAYIDFNWPGTSVNVKAGIQPVSLPAAIGGGSMIENERGGAVFVSSAMTDNVSLLLGWARFEGASTTTGKSELDGFIAALPLAFEGFSMTPFAVYAPIGEHYTAGQYAGLASLNASGTDYKAAYWLGSSFTMDLFDPFVLKADINYGAVDADNSQDERSGWLFDAALEYKGFDFMTPEAYFVYTSGEDGDSKNGTSGSSERMPTIAGDWAVGSFWFGGDSITSGAIDDETNQNGFWLVGLSLNDIQSFAEGLTHNVHVFYAQGTNDKNSVAATNAFNGAYGRYLTEKDSLWEVSATTAYKIYDELTAYVDLGYLNLDADTSVWGADNKGGDAWKVSTGVVYQF